MWATVLDNSKLAFLKLPFAKLNANTPDCVKIAIPAPNPYRFSAFSAENSQKRRCLVML